MGGNGKPPGAPAPGGPALDPQQQAFLQAVGQNILQGLVMSYPEVAKVRPQFMQEVVGATLSDFTTWDKVLRILVSPDCAHHAVRLTIVKPPSIVGAEEQVIAEIAGRLDTTACESADEFLQSITVIGFILSPEMRARLYMKGYRVRGAVLQLQKPVDPIAKS